MRAKKFDDKFKADQMYLIKLGGPQVEMEILDSDDSENLEWLSEESDFNVHLQEITVEYARWYHTMMEHERTSLSSPIPKYGFCGIQGINSTANQTYAVSVLTILSSMH